MSDEGNEMRSGYSNIKHQGCMGSEMFECAGRTTCQMQKCIAKCIAKDSMNERTGERLTAKNGIVILYLEKVGLKKSLSSGFGSDRLIIEMIEFYI